MISWDIIMACAQGFLAVFLVPTALKHDAFVPRLTSGTTAAGLTVIAAALFNLSAPIGGTVALISVALWVIIFVLRGTPPKEA